MSSVRIDPLVDHASNKSVTPSPSISALPQSREVALAKCNAEQASNKEGTRKVDNLQSGMTNIDNSIKRAFLNLREAAQFTGISTVTLRRAIKAKALPHHRLGFSETHGRIMILKTDLETYIQKSRVG